jgi:hypothetical protein
MGKETEKLLIDGLTAIAQGINRLGPPLPKDGVEIHAPEIIADAINKAADTIALAINNLAQTIENQGKECPPDDQD